MVLTVVVKDSSSEYNNFINHIKTNHTIINYDSDDIHSIVIREGKNVLGKENVYFIYGVDGLGKRKQTTIYNILEKYKYSDVRVYILVDSILELINKLTRLGSVKYFNTPKDDTSLSNNIHTVKMVFFEEDRSKVFRRLSLIKDYHLNQLYPLIFGSLVGRNIKGLRKLNTLIYRAKPQYIKSFLAYTFPLQDSSVRVKITPSCRLSEVEESVRKAIQKRYKCSVSESKQYLKIIKKLMDKPNFDFKLYLQKLGLPPKELEFFGVKTTKRVERIEKKIVKRVKKVEQPTLLGY
tara:strand:+ start:30949 stop:31827 length:879 start_codon:yes stop_codon:yes gene_type:complete